MNASRSKYALWVLPGNLSIVLVKDSSLGGKYAPYPAQNTSKYYDNTKAKLSELESAYLEKTQELEMLKRSLASDEEKL